MKIGADDLHIWKYTFNESSFNEKIHDPILSMEENERAARYVFECDKTRYIVNRRFVRIILSRYLNCSPDAVEIDYHKNGKPYIVNSGLYFNYSYRKNHCILGIATSAEVGVDIEFMKTLNDIDTFISYTFSEKEKAIIYQSNADGFSDTLFTFWTYKEAIIKAIGIGLNTDLSKIDLSAFFYSRYNPVCFSTTTYYTLSRLKAPDGYKAAFGINSEFVNLTEFDYV